MDNPPGPVPTSFLPCQAPAEGNQGFTDKRQWTADKGLLGLEWQGGEWNVNLHAPPPAPTSNSEPCRSPHIVRFAQSRIGRAKQAFVSFRVRPKALSPEEARYGSRQEVHHEIDHHLLLRRLRFGDHHRQGDKRVVGNRLPKLHEPISVDCIST